MQIPTLTTDRLILRGYREDDAPAIAALHGDPEVIRYISPDGVPEPSLADAWDHIARHVGHWALKGYGKWAVDERATGRFVGRAGLYDPPYDWVGLELGWTFPRDVWGRGYATEASAAAMRWAFETMGANEVVSAIHPGNAASIRVAERLGERKWRDGTLNGKPALIYGITKDEWRARNART